VTWIVTIIVREVLGYETYLRYNRNTLETLERLAYSSDRSRMTPAHVNVEVWPSALQPDIERWVSRAGEVHNLGPIGYSGRGGWYTTTGGGAEDEPPPPPTDVLEPVALSATTEEPPPPTDVPNTGAEEPPPGHVVWPSSYCHPIRYWECLQNRQTVEWLASSPAANGYVLLDPAVSTANGSLLWACEPDSARRARNLPAAGCEDGVFTPDACGGGGGGGGGGKGEDNDLLQHPPFCAPLLAMTPEHDPVTSFP
jgi:hypothetical protein